MAIALSLYECIGWPVLAAFDAGNLQAVAEMARARYLERKIILCADNDCETDGNPGLTKATAAALAVPRHESQKCDWNDLHHLVGAGEVRTQFMMHEERIPPAPPLCGPRWTAQSGQERKKREGEARQQEIPPEAPRPRFR